jgi:hypothetical protein
MISAENNRKLAFSGVARYDTSYGLADPGYESRVLHLPNRRIILPSNLFELVVSVKLNLPS